MSISSEISRISGNVSDALDAISAKGVTVPSGSNSDDLATLIASIQGGGYTITDVSNATGTTAQISAGGGGGGATQHTIHLEFSDNTDTDIAVYYDDALLGTMIAAYNPSGTWTYNSKTVVEAQLDGTTFYEATVIPIGVQLIDYTACLYNTAINSSGQAVTQEWYYASDFTPIETGMSFSYRAGIWFYMGFYDANQDVIATIYVYNYATQDPNDTNTGYGNISGANIPANAKYLRMSGTAADSSHMSLIRTA